MVLIVGHGENVPAHGLYVTCARHGGSVCELMKECGGSGVYDPYYSEFGVWLTDHTRWVVHTFFYPYGVVRNIRYGNSNRILWETYDIYIMNNDNK